MTCYFRHLQTIFNKAGVNVTKENKKAIDRYIHKIVGVEYKNCPSTWQEVKKAINENEERFVEELRKATEHLG